MPPHTSLRPESRMTVSLVVSIYLAAGAVFGCLTAAERHRYSEGPSRRADDADARGERIERALWVLLCAALWPVMLFSHLGSAWLRRRPASRAATPSSRPTPRSPRR